MLNLSVRSAAEACEERGVDRVALRRLAVWCGYLHAEAIPRWLLKRCLVYQSDLGDADADTVLDQLVEFSILSVQGRSADSDPVDRDAGEAALADSVETTCTASCRPHCVHTIMTSPNSARCYGF